MRNNTRFAPTPTGYLHLGHLFLCLLNRDEAQSRGGKFIVRVENLWAKEALPQLSAKYVRGVGEKIISDMEWAGVPPDFVSWQDETEELDRQMLSLHPEIPLSLIESSMNEGGVKSGTALLHHTAGKVIFDNYTGCDPIIRGDDLKIEHYWYVYLCTLFGFPIPEMCYVPRLMLNREVMSKSGIVKITLAELRAKGFSPQDVEEVIRDATLADRSGKFLMANTKIGIELGGYPVRKAEESVSRPSSQSKDEEDIKRHIALD